MLRAAYALFLIVLVAGLSACSAQPSAPVASAPATAPASIVASAAPSMSAAASAAPSAAAASAEASTAAAPGAAVSAADRADGLIVFLDQDGETIATIRPDGSDRQTLTTIVRSADQDVGQLSASRDGRYLAYTLSDRQTYAQEFVLVSAGQARPLTEVGSLPVWHDDRFVANLRPVADQLGALALFDPARGEQPVATFGVIGFAPAWSADGARIVFIDQQDNIAQLSVADPQAPPTTLLELNAPAATPTAAGYEPDHWLVSWATLTPDGQALIFAGEQLQNQGASGNGQRIWRYDLSSGQGKAGLEPLGEPGGRYSDYDVLSPQTLVVASDVHSSACEIAPALELRGVEPGPATTIELPIPAGRYGGIDQVSAPPADQQRGRSFAYSLTLHDCELDAPQPNFDPPALYVWSDASGQGALSRKIADGRLPVWIAPQP